MEGFEGLGDGLGGGGAAEEEGCEDAEGVDVGGDGDAFSAALLGAGVVGGKGVGGFGIGGGGGEEVGDAEVEEPGFAFAGDEDVGGLEVGVDDEMTVGVVDGVDDFEEEVDALLEGEAAKVAELVDGETVDELHDDVVEAFGGGSAIEEADDAGVVERGEDAAFLGESGGRAGGEEVGVEDFDGDALGELLDSLAEIDGSHAAGTE